MATYKKINWLASYPKSGTTWIRMFLNAYMTKFPLNLNSAYQYVANDINPALMQLTTTKCVNDLSVNEQFLYRTAMLGNIVELCPINNVCLKTHNAKVRVDDIPAIPPNLSNFAIYVIRDPRDVCISLSNHMGLTIDETIGFMGNLSQAIEMPETRLVHILLTWAKHVASWTTENENLQTMVLRYEDLLAEPREMFITILEALNLDKLNNAEERLDFALQESKFENLKKLEKVGGFIEQGVRGDFFRVGSNGQWKSDLTEDERYQIESEHEDVMEEYGYI